MWELFEFLFSSKLFWSTSFVFAIYFYLKLVTFNYFKKNNIPAEDCVIPFGNLLPIATGQKCIGHLILESYERFKSHPYHGLYMLHVPQLIINDPELIRHIMVKDFNTFQDRGLYFNKETDPLSAHLFFLPGDEWKHLRTKLSPTFTSGKIKQLFPLVEKVGGELVKELNNCVDKSNIVEIKDILSRFTTDVISSIAFGLECNSLKNPEADFRVFGKKCISVHPFKTSMLFFCSTILDILKIPLTPHDATKFFLSVFSEVIDYRRKNYTVRKDFLNLLIQLMDNGEVEDEGDAKNLQKKQNSVKNIEKISMIDACAQSFVFFVAGFETSSTTTTYCLHELAQNQEIQDKLRKEIHETMGERRTITYEDVFAMSYLDKVVSETLRKHPIVPILNRIALKDYKIPNSDFCIREGMQLIIPVLGLHSDPNFYPNPEEFRPERFDSDQVAKRHMCTYIPFGEGPRICIGKRFGLLQVKVAVIEILLNFKVNFCGKTENPLVPTNRNLLLTPDNDVFLEFERLK